jgi:phage gpG-like protein
VLEVGCEVQARVEVRVGGALRGQFLDRAWERFVPKAKVILSQLHASYFAEQRSPEGDPWAPLKSATYRKSVQKAIAKVGGREARPRVVKTRTGGLKVIAQKPRAGFQRTAVVRRTRGSQILIDTGRLRQSVVVNAARADAIRKTRRYTLIWGTRVPYAPTHQFGSDARRIPARPFLGVSDAGMRELQRALEVSVNEARR